MCVICIKKAGKKLTKDAIHKMFIANPHGCGCAWLDSGKIYCMKGLMTESDICAVAGKLKSFEAVFHFRIATAGKVEAKQTHPFAISPNLFEIMRATRTMGGLLFHNGIISDFGNDEYSDTIDFIQRVLSKLDRAQDRHDLLRSLDSKFAIIWAGKIIEIGRFFDWQGLRVSNTSFDWSASQYGRYGGKYRSDSDFDDYEEYYSFPKKDYSTPIAGELPARKKSILAMTDKEFAEYEELSNETSKDDKEVDKFN